MVSESPGTDIATLLLYYGFDLSGKTPSALVEDWMREFQVSWVRLATIEALYQGRYKAISIEQILILWQRRGQPICHFNREFEAMVCHQLPELTNASNNTTTQTPLKPVTFSSPLPQRGNLKTAALAEGDRLKQPKHPKSTNSERERPTYFSTTNSEIQEQEQGQEGEGENEENFSDNATQPRKQEGYRLSSPTANPSQPPDSENTSKQSIEKFMPSSQDSHFYKKLKAVADSKINTVE
ncbi:MAG: hypothetical protein F6K21_35430 [Symploca sp. SIO2D2]|nr:hypothetical protein [Symploca sp. SIO2D2]